MTGSKGTPGAYEPPKAAKERVTLVPSKSKSTRGSGRGNTCMSMAMVFPIDAQVSKYGKFFGLNLYFDGTRAYTAVARSFAAFGGSYAPGTMHRPSSNLLFCEY